MAGNPWDSRAGQYDRPSSGVPARDASPRRESAPLPPGRSDFIARRAADVARQGVIATGTGTILERIDAAMLALVRDGLGDARCIYLTDSDLLAFREAHGGSEWRNLRVGFGVSSKVYSARGSRAVRRPQRIRT